MTTRKELRCPYCKSKDISFDGDDIKKEVIIDGERAGSITFFGAYCTDADCKGRNGFNIQVGFKLLMNDVYYTDSDGYNI